MQDRTGLLFFEFAKADKIGLSKRFLAFRYSIVIVMLICPKTASLIPLADYVSDEGFPSGRWVDIKRCKYQPGKLKKTGFHNLKMTEDHPSRCGKGGTEMYLNTVECTETFLCVFLL